MKNHLRDIIEGVSNTYGDDFLNSITLQLNKVIGADYTFIARLDQAQRMSHTIALVVNNQLVDNIAYSLIGTPCSNVIDDSVCCYPTDVCALFPDDQLLADMSVQAYLGTPLHNSKGEVIGLIVALYQHQLVDPEFVTALFQIFSGRISAEIERQDYESSLKNFNRHLEEKVAQRTASLTHALDELKHTQKQLIESEKLASLSNIVAGLAHELNTPLGISITSHSVLEQKHIELTEHVKNGKISLSEMNHYIEAVDEILLLQKNNLQRSKELIDSFKNIAGNQLFSEATKVNFHQYLQNFITTIKCQEHGKQFDIVLKGDTDVRIDTVLGVHNQVLTSLVHNSLLHGFKFEHDNVITLTLTQQDDWVEVSYHDNGVGIEQSVINKVCEPFYTSARNQGRVGLGLAIVYSLIKRTLYGDISIFSHDEVSRRGFTLIYRFKK